MRCACCLRVLNPANAYTTRRERESADGLRWTEVANYGPVCAVRLGLTKPAPKLKRKPSRFAIFRTSQAVKVDDNQFDFFGVTA